MQDYSFHKPCNAGSSTAESTNSASFNTTSKSALNSDGEGSTGEPVVRKTLDTVHHTSALLDSRLASPAESRIIPKLEEKAGLFLEDGTNPETMIRETFREHDTHLFHTNMQRMAEELHRLQKGLKESVEEFRNAVQDAHASIFVLRGQVFILKFLGHSQQEMLRSILHRFQCVLHRQISTLEVLRWTWRRVDRMRTLFWFC